MWTSDRVLAGFNSHLRISSSPHSKVFYNHIHWLPEEQRRKKVTVSLAINKAVTTSCSFNVFCIFLWDLLFYLLCYISFYCPHVLQEDKTVWKSGGKSCFFHHQMTEGFTFLLLRVIFWHKKPKKKKKLELSHAYFCLLSNATLCLHPGQR